MDNQDNRRPLQTRQYAWAHHLAHFFVVLGVTPNQMSLASIGVALLGAVAYWGSVLEIPYLQPTLLVAAAIFIQLRLLANMLDGLMAVEEGKKTSTGALFNEVPDRVADILFLLAAGYASGWPELGWVTALLAVLTAYVRALGASLGFGQDYSGPMAKQHRMFTLTIGSLLAAFLPQMPILAITLVVILLGAVVTVSRRVGHIAHALSTGHHD
jgi:phosphatidylglycerophosphate synthase